MIRYCKNNNWTPTGIILNKNDMSRSYILLNDKDNVIPKNRRHPIKMNSNFVKIENHNDMDNHTETELKTRHSMSTTEPGEVNEPWENATEVRENRATQLDQEEK